MISWLYFWQFRVAVLALLLFDCLFLELRYSIRKTACIGMAVWMLSGVFDCYCYLYMKLDHTPIQVTLLYIVVIQAVPFLISKYRDFRALFVGLTASAWEVLGSVLAVSVYVMTKNIAGAILAMLLLDATMLVFLIWKCREGFLKAQERQDIQWKCLCPIPALFYASVHALLVWPVNVYDNPRTLLASYFVLALTLCSEALIFRLMLQLQKRQELQQNRSHLEDYARRLQQEADVMQEQELQAEVRRHDMRHLMILISGYLEEGKTEEARKLLGEMEKKMEGERPVRYCENIPVNSILTYAASRAKQVQVRFEVNAEVPRKLNISELDFAMALSNLTENALNAAAEAEEKEQRFVTVTMKGVKNQLILEIRNGFGVMPEISKETGLPVSRKGYAHGLGLVSVLNFVRENDVVFDYSVENTVFCVRLLVKNA